MRKILLFVLPSFFFFSSYAQFNSKCDKAWDYFAENDFSKAIEAFSALEKSSDADVASSALLGKTLCYLMIDYHDDSWTTFKQFLSIDPNADQFAYILWSYILQNSTQEDDKSKYFVDKLAKSNPSEDVWLASMYSQTEYLRQKGLIKEARELNKKCGNLTAWSLVGPFLNNVGSGFDKNYPPISEPNFNVTFKDKNDADIKWYIPKGIEGDNLLGTDMNNYIGSDGIKYMQTFVDINEAGDYYLQASCYGSIKIWVNDVEIMSDDKERYLFLGVIDKKVKLNKGVNRILVQLGNYENTTSSTSVRLLDKNRSVIYPQHSGTPKPYVKGNFTPENFAHSSITYANKLLKEYPNHIGAKIIAILAYMGINDDEKVNDLINEASELAPMSTYISYLGILHFSESKNGTDANKEREKILLNDPEGYISLYTKITEAFDADNIKEAEKLVNKFIEKYPNSTEVTSLKIKVFNKKELFNEFTNYMESLYQQNPNNTQYAYIAYLIAKDKGLNKKKIIKILEDGVKQDQSYKNLHILFDEYLELGRFEDAERILLDLHNNYPYNTDYLYDLADYYNSAHNYQAALNYINEIAEISPYDAGTWRSKGFIYLQMNDKKEALKYYIKAIEINPNLFELRTQIRDLQNRKYIRDYFDEVDPVALVKEAKKDKIEDDESIYVIYDNVERVVYPEGKTEVFYTILARANNKNGVEALQSYDIGYSYYENLNIIKAEIIKENGAKVKAETNGGKIVFPNLEPGDAIYIDYNIQSYSYGKLGKHFEDDNQFQLFVPAKYSAYKLLAPKDYKFNYKFLNGEEIPLQKKEMSENFVLYTWEVNNPETIENENFMPPITDVSRYLYLSSIEDWDFVCDWYSDMSSPMIKEDYVVKNAVNDIFNGADINKLSEIEKAEKIYNYITKDINYSYISFRQSGLVPQLPSKTITTKLGDCKDMSTLFCALADQVGLKAHLVLVQTGDISSQKMPLPSTAFNHCIVKFFAKEKPYYLELTDPDLPFLSATPSLIFASKLDIPRKNYTTVCKEEYVPQQNLKEPLAYRKVTITMENKDLKFNFNNYKTGSAASDLRITYKPLTDKEKFLRMQNSYKEDFKGVLVVENVKFRNLDNNSDTLFYDMDLYVKNEINEIAGIKVLSLPWADNYFNTIISDEDRKYGFNLNDLTSSTISEQVFKIIPETGYAILEIPQPINISNKFIDYSLTYSKLAKNQVEVKRIIKIKDKLVASEEVPEIMSAFKKIKEADTQQIGFKKM